MRIQTDGWMVRLVPTGSAQTNRQFRDSDQIRRGLTMRTTTPVLLVITWALQRMQHYSPAEGSWSVRRFNEGGPQRISPDRRKCP